MIVRPTVLTLLGLGLLGGTLSCGAAEPRHAPAVRAPAKPPLRNWTDVTGKFRIKAKLVEIGDGQVKLEKADGSVIRVPIEKLSEFDRKWLQRQPPPAAEAPGDAAASTPSSDWPCFRGANHDGKSPDTGLLKEWPVGGPPLAWKLDDVGKGYSGVAVANGTVYLTGDQGDALKLFAFDLNGKPKWQAGHGSAWTHDWAGSRATPTIDGDRLYLLSGTGLLGCFDAQTGKPLWSHDAKEFGGSPGQWGYAESVLIHGKLAIFKPGGKNCIVALDKTSGKLVWASQGIVAGPEYSSCLPVEAGSRTILVTGTREGLVAVDARSGGFLWGNPFAAGNTANCPTPAYADGYVFWANGYGKGGLCMKLGAGGRADVAWTTKDMVCHHGGYVIDGGYVYGSHDGKGWSCLELKTGRKMWESRGEVGKGSLCWADGMLYLFGEKDGRAALATCSPEGLEIRGKVQVPGDGPSWAHPVVVGGRLYLRYDTHLYCFDVRAK